MSECDLGMQAFYLHAGYGLMAFFMLAGFGVMFWGVSKL